MTAVACLVRQTPREWLVSIDDLTPLEIDADCTPDELAQAVLDYVELARSKTGDCRDKIVLCPEAREVLFATSPFPHSIKSRDRQQLKYHAESLLPIDAENMAADFIVSKNEIRVLAMDNVRWRPIVAAFAECNLHFRWIAPASILAIQEAMRTHRDVSRVIAWEENEVLDLWEIDASGIKHWTHLDDPSSNRMIAIRLFAAQVPGVHAWSAINCSPATLAHLNEIESLEVRSVQWDSLSTYTIDAANRLCRTSFEAWYDLRDGVIAGSDRYRALQGWVNLAATAVIGFFLTFSAACLWRGYQAEKQIAKVQEAHEQLFEVAFPGVSVPALISKKISSEHQKAQGSTNGNGEIKPDFSALDLLHSTLTAISERSNIHFRLSDIRITNGELTVDMFFENRQQAAAISERLKQAGIDTGPLNFTKESSGEIRVSFRGRMR